MTARTIELVIIPEAVPACFICLLCFYYWHLLIQIQLLLFDRCFICAALRIVHSLRCQHTFVVLTCGGRRAVLVTEKSARRDTAVGSAAIVLAN